MIDAESLVSGDRQRRMHKKSRNGCLQCKKRHVKVTRLLSSWNDDNPLTQWPSVMNSALHAAAV